MCNCTCLALPVEGHAVVYSAALCAILHALSCQCKEVHSRAEMPEACSLCWLAEAVIPYFPLSSTNLCNSDVPVQCQWNTFWSNLWQCISFHNCLIDNILYIYCRDIFPVSWCVKLSDITIFVMIFLAEGQWPFFAFMKFLTSPAFMNECYQRRICHQTYMFWVNFSGEYASAGGMGSMDSDGTKNVRNFNISPLRCTRNPSIDSNTNMKL